jgi:ABC-type Fe3+/spermidine/putrescine transport system ATPase subunit
MLSDRIGVMEKGRIVQLDTPRGVYEKPHSRFVGEFIGQSNFLRGRMVRVGPLESEFETDSGLTLRVPAELELSPGEEGIAQIRAERVRVHREKPPASAGNAFPGTAEREVYVGDMFQYFVRLDSSDLIMAIHPTYAGLALTRQEAVWISFDSDDIVWLRGGS